MKKVLLIEDTQEVRENLQEMLELKGFDTEVAVDGRQGLQRALQFIPDLIICDLKMPHLGGIELLKILQGEDQMPDIPVILISASAQKKDIEKGLAAGAQAYLTKPFTMAELFTEIERLIEK